MIAPSNSGVQRINSIGVMPNSTQPWEIDTRHLTALMAIAQTKSVSRAAEELGYGQSAVSQQLATLERIVGQRLVNRGVGPRPVSLTQAGTVFLHHAKWIIERLEIAQSELLSLSLGTSGSVRVGMFQSAGVRLLPKVLTAFRAHWPDIAVHLHSDLGGVGIPRLLLDGSLDVGFVESSNIVPGLSVVELSTDRFIALVPPSHRLAQRSSVRLHDFDGEDMVDAELTDSCAMLGARALRDAGIATNVVFRTNDNQTLQRLVDAGLGCAILPGLTVEPSLESGAVVVPLADRIERIICIAWAESRMPSVAVEAFVATARSTLESTPIAQTSSKKPHTRRKV